MVRCVRGRMTFEVEIAPRFDYGRSRTSSTSPTAARSSRADGLVDDRCTSSASPTTRGCAQVTTTDDGDLHASLRAGGRAAARGRARDRTDEPPREFRVAEAQQLLDDTARFWKSWLAQSTYTGRWREALQRSAITLKLMTYAPTGGLVAAPTAGLPEQVGGERNWDYRYTWVRDASFSVYALLRHGFTEEARRSRSGCGPGCRSGGARRRR